MNIFENMLLLTVIAVSGAGLVALLRGIRLLKKIGS